MPNQITAAVIQLSSTGEKASNLNKTADWVKKASEKGADLVVLQELHTTHYFCQVEDHQLFDLAEPIPGPSFEQLQQIAKTNKVVLVGSLFEKRMPGVYHNTAVVFDKDGSFCGQYRKMHIPDDPGFYEKYYFTPGDNDQDSQGFTPISTSIGKLGVLVCWDQWYPEAARLMALAGADVLIYPTAIGWDPADTTDEQQRQLDAWITIQRSHSVANHLPVLSANRTGFEADPSNQSKGIQFWGNSFISGAQGEILQQATADEETLLIAKFDKSNTERVRKIWPFFRDRRIDAYQDLTKRAR